MSASMYEGVVDELLEKYKGGKVKNKAGLFTIGIIMIPAMLFFLVTVGIYLGTETTYIIPAYEEMVPAYVRYHEQQVVHEADWIPMILGVVALVAAIVTSVAIAYDTWLDA